MLYVESQAKDKAGREELCPLAIPNYFSSS